MVGNCFSLLVFPSCPEASSLVITLVIQFSKCSEELVYIWIVYIVIIHIHLNLLEEHPLDHSVVILIESKKALRILLWSCWWVFQNLWPALPHSPLIFKVCPWITASKLKFMPSNSLSSCCLSLSSDFCNFPRWRRGVWIVLSMCLPWTARSQISFHSSLWGRKQSWLLTPKGECGMWRETVPIQE